MNQLDKQSLDSQLLGLIGIAKLANKAVVGSMVMSKIVQVKFLFMASDIGQNMKKKYQNKCSYYNIPSSDIYTSDTLSRAIGQDNRTVIGITDAGITKKIKELIEGGQDGKSK